MLNLNSDLVNLSCVNSERQTQLRNDGRMTHDRLRGRGRGHGGACGGLGAAATLWHDGLCEFHTDVSDKCGTFPLGFQGRRHISGVL